jgi:glucose/arabinose dehydrogenase
MGRDFLGDELPPDEINIILEGQDYGWPYCYGKRMHDAQFDPQGLKQDFCKDTVPSFIDLPAHSAPLGLAFFPEEWPQEFRYDLLVAYHGSWNRSTPTGYKVVRVRLDHQGNFKAIEDFITGWLTPAGALGRPVDILITDDGVIYISDDKAGVVYRVVYGKMVK